MYKINKYPDGQVNVKILRQETKLNIRIKSYEDLFLLKSISDVYKYNNWPLPTLFIPCLFGQLSDRRFLANESFDLKNICEFINQCEFPRIEILDPHSDVGPALLNCHIIKPCKFIGDVIDNIGGDIILVSPDAGAYKKIFKLAEHFNKELVAANKFRDREGNVSLHFNGNVSGKCLIIDDICLGGRTFIELANQLKYHGASEIYLYVTHGYFLKGFSDLKQFIDKIYCTNSVKDLRDDYCQQFKVI